LQDTEENHEKQVKLHGDKNEILTGYVLSTSAEGYNYNNKFTNSVFAHSVIYSCNNVL